MRTFAYADKGAEDRLQKIIAANSLDVAGKAPFHIKIAFQYYDLDGKPAETGTAEEWWVSPTQLRTEIVSPSLKEVFPVADSGTGKARGRESFLAHDLLTAAVHPIPRYTTFDRFHVHEATQDIGGGSLDCITVEPDDKPRDIPVDFILPPRFCVEPQSLAMRQRSRMEGDHITRNSIGVFHDVNVSLDLEISCGKKKGIRGHVTALTTFDPAKSSLALGTPPAGRLDHDEIPSARAVAIYGQLPALPPQLIAAHEHDVALLRGLVKEDGSVTGLTIMSRSDEGSGNSALMAVSRWKFKPFRVGNNPAEVYVTFFISPYNPHSYVY